MKILIRDINLRRILSANSMLKIFKSSIKNSSNEVITNHRTHNILIKLVKLLKGMICHVNLIPINKVEERDFERPDKTYIYKFSSKDMKSLILGY